ncbi:MAG TPA: hypothetical protein VK929_11540 [Longimicrobiales bacterium]|nr:hypothetical protein [Longimicrobiales bacterium]
MKTICVTACLVLALPAAAAARQAPSVPADPPVSAEPWFQRSVMLTAEVGGAAFSDFQRALARPAPGSAGDERAFRRRVSATTTTTLGTSATWWMSRGWGIRVGGSYTPSRFTVWNEAEASQQATVQTEEAIWARLDTWTAHAAAVFRFPFTMGRVVPYGIAGGGVVRYSVADDEELPPEARYGLAGGRWSGAAALVGVGSAIPLQRNNLLLNFELTGHVSRTPLGHGASGEEFQAGDVAMQLTGDDGSGSDGVGLSSHLRLTVGLTLPLRVGRQ